MSSYDDGDTLPHSLELRDGIWWCVDEDVNSNDCSDETRCNSQCYCNKQDWS
jgi:hypothetical protein